MGTEARRNWITYKRKQPPKPNRNGGKVLFMVEPSKILSEVLSLPFDKRAQLAALLIESLEPQQDLDVEEAWRAEIGRRVKELDDGTVVLLSWADARRQIMS